MSARLGPAFPYVPFGTVIGLKVDNVGGVYVGCELVKARGVEVKVDEGVLKLDSEGDGDIGLTDRLEALPR